VKLIDQIRRQPLFISFGRSSADSGFVNVELAAVRAASSVTLTAADGSAAPIAAADASNAGVMTAADKTKLDGLTPGSGAAPTDVASRAAVATTSIDAAVSHLRTAGYLSTGDGGGAVYRRGAAEPAHGLKVQSADGGWWELVPDPAGVSILQAGGKADGGATDNAAAFNAIIGYGRLNATTFYGGSLPVIYPAANDDYHHLSTLSLKQPCTIIGQGGSHTTNRTTRLSWAAGMNGIVIEHVDTENGNPTPATTTGAPGSRIENVTLVGPGSDSSSGANLYHGVISRTPRSILTNVSTTGWPGDGIHVEADVTSSGNSNGLRIMGGRAESNRRFGLYLAGGDANGCTIVGFDAGSNGGAGIYDNSFLGVAIVGGLLDNNDQRGQAHSGGNRYYVNPLALRDGLDPSVEQPGAGSAWILGAAGAANADYPDWVSGEDYYPSGAILCVNDSGRTGIFGTYAEGNQPSSYLEQNCFWYSGLQGAVAGPGTHMDGKIVSGNGLQMTRSDDTGSLDVWLRSHPDTALLLVENTTDHSAGWRLKWEGVQARAWTFLHANTTSRARLMFHARDTLRTFGRSVGPNDGALQIGTHWMGNANNARFRDVGVAAPASGEHAQGDIVWNRDPAAGGTVGWVCVTGGTPGTWKSFGAIEA